MNRIQILSLVAVAVVGMSACAAGPRTSVSTSPSGAQPSDLPSPSNGEVSDAPAGIPDTVWAAVLDDLARRLDRPPTDPVVVIAKAVTWNDGSLGCPKPGQVYTQALVDGFQVVVEVDAERFDYRSSGGDSVRLCEDMIEGG